MSGEVAIEADTDAVVADLTAMSDRIEDPSPAYKVIGELMDERNVQHDSKQIGVDGPYDALSPEYELQKEKRWPGKRILERTGDLQGNFYYIYDQTMAEAGNASDVAPFHMSDGPHSVIPRRNPTFWEDDLADEAEEVFSGFTLEGRL